MGEVRKGSHNLLPLTIASNKQFYIQWKSVIQKQERFNVLVKKALAWIADNNKGNTESDKRQTMGLSLTNVCLFWQHMQKKVAKGAKRRFENLFYLACSRVFKLGMLRGFQTLHVKHLPRDPPNWGYLSRVCRVHSTRTQLRSQRGIKLKYSSGTNDLSSSVIITPLLLDIGLSQISPHPRYNGASLRIVSLCF